MDLQIKLPANIQNLEEILDFDFEGVRHHFGVLYLTNVSFFFVIQFKEILMSFAVWSKSR